MNILAIDPGPKTSGIVIYETEGMTVEVAIPDLNNKNLVDPRPFAFDLDAIVYEHIESFGMAVGKSIFETVFWMGRIVQALGPERCYPVTRKEVKLFLCNSLRAKDSNIRRAILDLFPATGGGKTPQIGTKKQPGPLYGVSSHSMSALALALTFVDTQEEGLPL